MKELLKTMWSGAKMCAIVAVILAVLVVAPYLLYPYFPITTIVVWSIIGAAIMFLAMGAYKEWIDE